MTMIKFSRLAISMLLLLLFLSACSLFGNKEPEYLHSVEGKPLKIPAGMNSPAGSRAVVISVPMLRMPAGDELEPMPPRVVSTAGKKDTNAYMAWSSEGVYLFVKDTPKSVARRLGYAIEHSGMTMLEKDASGAHKFHYTQVMSEKHGFFSSMAFWRDKAANYSGVFMTKLTADENGTRVYLRFGNGKEVDTAGAEHVLGIFMERLG